MGNLVKIKSNGNDSVVFSFEAIDFDLIKDIIKDALAKTLENSSLTIRKMDIDEDKIVCRVKDTKYFSNNLIEELRSFILNQKVDLKINGKFFSKEEILKEGRNFITSEIENVWNEEAVKAVAEIAKEELKAGKTAGEEAKANYDLNFDYEDIKQRHEMGIFRSNDPIYEYKGKTYTFNDIIDTNDKEFLKTVYLEYIKRKKENELITAFEYPDVFPQKIRSESKKIENVMKAVAANKMFTELNQDKEIINANIDYLKAKMNSGLMFIEFSYQHNKKGGFHPETPLIDGIKFKKFKQMIPEKQAALIDKMTDIFVDYIKEYNKDKKVFSQRGELARVFIKNLAFEIDDKEIADKKIDEVHEKLTKALEEINKNIKSVKIPGI